VQQARAIDAAVETFRIFEEWMFDWRAAPSCLDRLAVSSGSEN
jgi:hypothetical protein